MPLKENIVLPAEIEDVPFLLVICNEVILNSTAIYEEKPMMLEERTSWFENQQKQGNPVLVIRDEKGVSGFASFSAFGGRFCYGPTVEHSVHIRHDCRGRGLGRLLMTELINHARLSGRHSMIGRIDASNQPSILFHERLGFTRVGLLKEVGLKFGRRLNLAIMQKML